MPEEKFPSVEPVKKIKKAKVIDKISRGARSRFRRIFGMDRKFGKRSKIDKERRLDNGEVIRVMEDLTEVEQEHARKTKDDKEKTDKMIRESEVLTAMHAKHAKESTWRNKTISWLTQEQAFWKMKVKHFKQNLASHEVKRRLRLGKRDGRLRNYKNLEVINIW